MLITTPTDASAFTPCPAASPLPPTINSPETVRHLLFGSLPAVQSTIATLHKRGYADPNDWSRPLSTGRPGEVMVILTRRISL